MSVDPSRGSKPASPPSDADGRPPKEEPDFVNEADIPTDDEGPGREIQRDGRSGSANPNPDVLTPRNAEVAGVESAAGEEDPGAALDIPPRSPT